MSIQKNFIFTSMRIMRMIGKNVPFENESKVWEPVKDWSTIYSDNVGKWNKNCIVSKNTELNYCKSLIRGELNDTGDLSLYHLFRLFHIPTSKPCNFEGALEVSYNLGLFQGFDKSLESGYQSSYYDELVDVFELDNFETYIKPFDKDGLVMRDHEFDEFMKVLIKDVSPNM